MASRPFNASSPAHFGSNATGSSRSSPCARASASRSRSLPALPAASRSTPSPPVSARSAWDSHRCKACIARAPARCSAWRFAMALSTAVASLCSHSAELAILALAVWGFGYGMIAALGPGASAIGVNATTALIIFERYPMPLHVAAMAGARHVRRRFAPDAVARRTLADRALSAGTARARRRLSRACRSTRKPSDASTRVPSTTELIAVRKTLADPRPFGRPLVLAAFQSLLDEAVRIRSSLALLTTVGGDKYARLRPVIAQVLDADRASARRRARARATSRCTARSTRRRTIPTCARSTDSSAPHGDLRAFRSADSRCPNSTIRTPAELRELR